MFYSVLWNIFIDYNYYNTTYFILFYLQNKIRFAILDSKL